MLLIALASFFALQWSTLAAPGGGGRGSNRPPTATVKNGTYVGRYLPEYDQDLFLGMPYAQPPVGNLRFAVPQSLNTTWSGTRSAEEFSVECVGYGSDQFNYNVSEDCLYINVIRPSGFGGQKLPVALWIHGGGFTEGGGIDQRYNLSFMVQNSVAIGKPIIGVSINYRLSVWGFLTSAEVLRSGNTNLGLRDQRLALHWVQENIEAFRGDSKKVTIWGESAGAASVGFHLTAYGGRDDSLFRGAIMESGNPVFYAPLNMPDSFQPVFDSLVNRTNCAHSLDKLQCLRELPFPELNGVINGTTLTNGRGFQSAFNPIIDGDFLEGKTSIQLSKGQFVKVPILDGANSDEGTAFSPIEVNNTADFLFDITHSSLAGPAPPSLAAKLLIAYPDDPAVEVVASMGNAVPGPPFGAQFRRSASYYGDLVMIANRRLACETWTRAGLPVFCYRFNAIPAGLPPQIGVTHFQEVSFVFFNIMGVGYIPAAEPPFTNKSESYIRLSRFMDSNWISFVHDQDPNAWRLIPGNWNGPEAFWPKYNLANPEIIVFDANVSSHAEPDTFRAEGINLIIQNSAEVYHR